METHSFGYWLRLKRKALDLTRSGLAERVGCSAATIQKLEEEERRPSPQIIERLAAIFNIHPNEHAAFLRFARGELRSAIAETKEDAPWNNAAKRPRSNLPTPVTSLIGREKEIVDVLNYLLRADVRLLTLTGPPGIGKTRLAVEAARTSLPDFPQGVFFASLASLDNPARVAVTVAQAMGYVGARNVSTNEQLKEGIGNKQMLLVLDNCEHLIEGVASFAAELLSTCSSLKILATSRESLRVPGEWLYPVSALNVPAFEVLEEGVLLDVKSASDYPALTLFAERARAVQPDFQLNAENLKIISTICKQSDGLPLAIELIAARIRFMSPQALLERLTDSLLAVADEKRATPARQKSLKSAIDWSYKLLSEEEQTLLASLSVFSSEFTVEAAETIFSPVVKDKPVYDLIALLLDKSLLQRSFDAGSRYRYAMLATVQEFARQRLRETDQEAKVRDRHLMYFLDLAGQADRELRGQNQRECLHRLHTMRDDLHAALDWAIETKQTKRALQMAHRLWWFWSMRSEFNEGRQWLGRVLDMPDVSSFSDLYAEVLTQMAHHTYLQLGGNEAKSFVEQAVSVARLHGNAQTLANALMVFGLVLTSEEDFAAAQSTLGESMTLFRNVEDRWGYALGVMSLGYSAYQKDDRATALTRNEQALTAFRELGDQYFQSVCLYEIGSLRVKQADWEQGLEDLRESLILARDLGSKYESASGLLRLAETEQYLGHPARAVRLYWAARNVYDSIGAWRREDDPKLEGHLASCHTALSESEFAEAVAEGQAMTMEQAIDYALSIDS